MDEIQTDRSFQGEHGPSRAAEVISQVDTTQAWGQLSLWSQDRGSDLTRIPLPQGSHDLPLAVIISDRMGSSVCNSVWLTIKGQSHVSSCHEGNPTGSRTELRDGKAPDRNCTRGKKQAAESFRES